MQDIQVWHSEGDVQVALHRSHYDSEPIGVLCHYLVHHQLIRQLVVLLPEATNILGKLGSPLLFPPTLPTKKKRYYFPEYYIFYVTRHDEHAVQPPVRNTVTHQLNLAK